VRVLRAANAPMDEEPGAECGPGEREVHAVHAANLGNFRAAQ
jgi:hypothetical protein